MSDVPPSADASTHHVSDQEYERAAADYGSALAGFRDGRVQWPELVVAYRRLAAVWR